MKPISYARHRFPPNVIRQAVWLYLRCTLSYRDVEELRRLRSGSDHDGPSAPVPHLDGAECRLAGGGIDAAIDALQRRGDEFAVLRRGQSGTGGQTGRSALPSRERYHSYTPANSEMRILVPEMPVHTLILRDVPPVDDAQRIGP
jgi:hypothetical protein